MSVTTLFGRPAGYDLPEDAVVLPRPTAPATHLGTQTRLGTEGVDLVEVVSRVAATPALWRQHARLEGAQRRWTRLEVAEGVDVWVIVWSTSARTELHDHGDAAAAFTVVRGQLTEIRPDGEGRLLPRRFAPGLVAEVAPGDIHDVTNEFAQTAVSIHAYAPKLRQMTFYGRDAAGRIVQDRVVDTTLPEAH